MRHLAIAALSLAALATTATAKINVLIITGDDAGSHKWQETTPATKEILTSSGKFDVTVAETITVLDNADDLNKYDLIYLAMFNAKTPTASDAGKANLLNFVKGGKGFVVAHLASASFKEWDEFKKLCGRYWGTTEKGKAGHGPRSVFKVNIADKNSPITKGLAEFDQDDELYAKLQGEGPIHVLVTADSDWSKATEPLAFTLDYGKGRVFHHTFGHDVKALQTPSVQTLIQRGCEWAASGKVK